jgi:solute carrier family 25 carnitine/acylcarnitine transporter 20/29
MSDLFASTIAGATTVLSGYPLDTLKTWKQSKHIEKPTIWGVYRGVWAPLGAQSLITTSLFGIHKKANSYGYNHYQSGMVSGFLSSIIISPIELYKVRKQNELSFKRISPFLGLWATIARETPAACIFFGSYYAQKQFYEEKEWNVPALIPGGISGVLSWAFTYPIDVVKTRVQSSIPLKDAIKQGNFKTGFGFCMLRAMVANAAAFTVYELFI